MRRQGAKLVAVTIFAGAALIASCAKPYHEETERYVFVATNIKLPYWREGEAGGFGRGQNVGGKRRTHRSDHVRPQRRGGNVPPDRGTAPRGNLRVGGAARDFPIGD